MSAADQNNIPRNEYYLVLGSNISPEENLRRAIKLLKVHGLVEKVSSVWRSEAVGGNGPDFLNICILFFSSLKPNELKFDVLRPIEKTLGRVRSSDKNAPRTIDIDILIHDGIQIDDAIWDSAHLVVPLANIHPEYRNSATNELLSDVAQDFIASNVIWPELENFVP